MREEQLRYDKFGRLILEQLSADDHSGTQFAYDQAGRLTRVKPPSATAPNTAITDLTK